MLKINTICLLIILSILNVSIVFAKGGGISSGRASSFGSSRSSSSSSFKSNSSFSKTLSKITLSLLTKLTSSFNRLISARASLCF